jgi:hypothetical protein
LHCSSAVTLVFKEPLFVRIAPEVRAFGGSIYVVVRSLQQFRFLKQKSPEEPRQEPLATVCFARFKVR